MGDAPSPSPRAPWSRRQVLEAGLKGGAAAGLGAYALSPDAGLAQQVPLEYDGSKFQLSAPEPNPKRGGVLRYGITSRPPHFDVHQSGTINNLGAQGCMFDNLVRRDPRDSGKTIIPDLAHSWEIAKDGQTYTFFLRQDVQFHDGADAHRRRRQGHLRPHRPAALGHQHPPLACCSPRSARSTSRDPHTIEFKLAEPRPANFMMGAFASGWNVILRKKTLEDNNYNLRRVVTYPGTGPFRPVRRVENEVWVMERNPNYWNKGLPYLDGIEFYHGLPFSPELGSAFLSGRIDYARVARPGDPAPGQADAGHVGHRLLPERHPGDLGEQPEEALRRPARPPRDAPGARQGGARRGGEGRRADDGRRLHLPVLGLRHAEGRSFRSASATRPIPPPPSGKPRR